MTKHPRVERNLVIVLGDQLDAGSAALDGFDRQRDAVWMAEAAAEATHVWASKPRIAVFLAAMRHFRDRLQSAGITVLYRELDAMPGETTLAAALGAVLRSCRPQTTIVVKPGDYRVEQSLRAAARAAEVDLDIRADRHFLSTPEEFAEHAEGRKQLRMEFFYRTLRRRTGVLMDGDQPVGGRWNYDVENRGAFGRQGPGLLAAPPAFAPDATTRGVLELVQRRFAAHPGRLDRFAWPVTAEQAAAALRDFVQHRLPQFGQYQDAMWVDQPFLYHSLLSASMNLKLLDPREVLAAAEDAYRRGRAPLNAVEGFIRQILGWREYVRGVYWRFMPEYLARNALGAHLPLPAFYWTGQTEMNCLRQAIRQTLDYGYAHHIQRLMVTGLFALLLGVRPQAVHEWYLAVYVDAVEWVELPNTLGMSQYADGGVMASKPYVASGKYIQRMSNYCRDCRFRPDRASGEAACPFTTLYWDFLQRHRAALAGNPRMQMQVRNLDRLGKTELRVIQQAADGLRRSICA